MRFETGKVGVFTSNQDVEPIRLQVAKEIKEEGSTSVRLTAREARDLAAALLEAAEALEPTKST